MRLLAALTLCVLLSSCASDQIKLANIGGKYYLQSGLTDRKQGDLGLVLVHGSPGTGLKVIDEHIGDGGRFGWHLIGENIIYARELPQNPNQLYIYKLYSPESGYYTLSNRYVHSIRLTDTRLILFHTSEEHRHPDNVTEYKVDDLKKR